LQTWPYTHPHTRTHTPTYTHHHTPAPHFTHTTPHTFYTHTLRLLYTHTTTHTPPHAHTTPRHTRTLPALTHHAHCCNKLRRATGWKGCTGGRACRLLAFLPFTHLRFLPVCLIACPLWAPAACRPVPGVVSPSSCRDATWLGPRTMTGIRLIPPFAAPAKTPRTHCGGLRLPPWFACTDAAQQWLGGLPTQFITWTHCYPTIARSGAADIIALIKRRTTSFVTDKRAAFRAYLHRNSRLRVPLFASPSSRRQVGLLLLLPQAPNHSRAFGIIPPRSHLTVAHLSYVPASFLRSSCSTPCNSLRRATDVTSARFRASAGAPHCCSAHFLQFNIASIKRAFLRCAPHTTPGYLTARLSCAYYSSLLPRLALKPTDACAVARHIRICYQRCSFMFSSNTALMPLHHSYHPTPTYHLRRTQGTYLELTGGIPFATLCSRFRCH